MDQVHQYLYRLENVLDEFVIVMLSLGAVFVSVYSIFWSTSVDGFVSFGKAIEPWITMLALMIIARELWLMNLHNRSQAQGE